jgi:hypothetical protein
MISLKDLTVFLITSGENPNYENCFKALKEQTVNFKIDIIKDYCPMSVALQEMHKRCTTAYFVECDEDMILKQESIEKMYKDIVGTSENISMRCYLLKDIHLNFDIYGIKIYKYEIFKKYPYNINHASCEIEQLNRMKVDGYLFEYVEEVLGNHSPLWTNADIFERYFNLMEKFKSYKYYWMGKLPSKLLELVKKDPSDLNIYALLGACTSIASENTILTGEKNFKYKRKEFINIENFIKNSATK